MAARGDSIFSPLFGEVAIDMARTQGKEKKNFWMMKEYGCHSSIVTTLTCVIKEKNA